MSGWLGCGGGGSAPRWSSRCIHTHNGTSVVPGTVACARGVLLCTLHNAAPPAGRRRCDNAPAACPCSPAQYGVNIRNPPYYVDARDKDQAAAGRR